MLAPAALLAIAAEPDSNIPLGAVRSAAARAGEPNRLVPLPIGHFDNCEEPWRAQPVEEAVAWFRTVGRDRDHLEAGGFQPRLHLAGAFGIHVGKQHAQGGDSGNTARRAAAMARRPRPVPDVPGGGRPTVPRR